MQSWGGVKAFAATTAGKVALIGLMTATLIGAFLYLGPYLTVPTFLVFGMLVPIYLGWKRPRQLALAGLIALLIAAPLTAPLEASALLQPSPAVGSAAFLPYGNGSAVIQNAVVHPFNAPAGSRFNFTAQLYPQYVPRGDSPLLWVTLWVSTCPGATSNSSQNCQSGYAFFQQNDTLGNATPTPSSVSFSVTLPGDNIWWWQMAGAVRNLSNQNLTWIFVDPGNGYGAVQGPVTGNFLSTYEYVLPAVYLAFFGYAGLVYFFALLVYAFFKSREARRQRERDSIPGPLPGGSATRPGAPPARSASATGGAAELTCPNCKAVVYPNEATCWKCGASLTAPSAPAPLP
ncbi:MAG: hypothetical protein L3K19_02220 [Thermoplasmata archaeon]|nr:hypothetical protein [Thermoplasmata archaeon]